MDRFFVQTPLRIAFRRQQPYRHGGSDTGAGATPAAAIARHFGGRGVVLLLPGSLTMAMSERRKTTWRHRAPTAPSSCISSWGQGCQLARHAQAVWPCCPRRDAVAGLGDLAGPWYLPLLAVLQAPLYRRCGFDWRMPAGLGCLFP